MIIGKIWRYLTGESRHALEKALSLMPDGHIGFSLRRHYWGRRFGIPENDIKIHSGVVFFGRESISVGYGCTFGWYAVINAMQGEIRIGNNVISGPHLIMRAANHRYRDPSVLIRDQGHCFGRIVIEDDCWIGAHVVILSNVVVGRGSVIGAGSVVTKSIPEYSVVVGVPARVVGSRGDKQPGQEAPLPV